MTTDDPTALELVAAACRAPGDDAPRLALADRLEEIAAVSACPGCDNGWRPKAGTPDRGMVSRCPKCGGSGEISDGNRERAWLVRDQVYLYGLDPREIGKHAARCGNGSGCPVCAAAARSRDLLARWGRPWAKWHNAFLPPAVSAWDPVTARPFPLWCRGFPSAFFCPGVGVWFKHGPAAVKHLPCERVVFADPPAPAADNTGRTRWRWWATAHYPPNNRLGRHFVPEEWAAHFSLHTSVRARRAYLYPSPLAAREDLAAAAARWARATQAKSVAAARTPG